MLGLDAPAERGRTAVYRDGLSIAVTMAGASEFAAVDLALDRIEEVVGDSLRVLGDVRSVSARQA